MDLITKSKKRRALLSAALVLASAGVFASQQASATLGGTTFEGNDGNIVAGGGVDWANLASQPGATLAVGIDQQTGQCDNSFTQGSKEDETAVVIGLGSIPNNKADIGKFAVGSETRANGHVYMYLAWVRNNDGGTTNFDFEINQKTQPNMEITCPGGVDRPITLIRSGDGAGTKVDDILIGYDLQGGASTPTLSIRKWTGTAWSAADTLDPIESEGRVNTGTGAGAITLANSGPFSQAINATRFGEAAIDLTQAGIIPNQNTSTDCIAFGSAYVKSRASSSFSAQMKDYSAPIAIGLNTCGSITIDKVTAPTGAAQSFNFDGTPAAPTNQLADFALTDAAAPQVFSNLTPGNYSVSEALGVAGWDLTALSCTESVSTVGSTVTVATGVSSIKLDPKENVVCTYTNTQRGRVLIDKVTQPDPDPTETVFDFTGSFGPFTLSNAAAAFDSGPIVPGSYNVAETAEPGWTPVGSSCSDQSPVTAINVGPGETVTCTFTNQGFGHIIVHKSTDPAGATQAFEFDTNYGVNFSLTDGQSNDSGAIAPGLYSVDELTPAGWEESGATCSDGSPVTGIVLTPGETVDCYFTNEQDAAITVIKHVVGPNPDNQSFTFTSNFGVTELVDQGEFTSAALDPDTYSVSEDVPPNWALLDASCGSSNGGSEDPANIDLQAGEQVICTFTNERQVGALKLIKTAKSASAVGGVAPVAGVSFEVTDADGVVDTYTTGADGTVCVNNYGFQTLNVKELVPAGYAPIADQEVVIDAVSYCDPEEYGAAPFEASFVNVPLTDVSIVVHSQVAGATSTVIDCGPAGSTTVSDGQLDISNLLPTDPEVTLTCTITVDP